MSFTKEFLRQSVENQARENVYKLNPYETIADEKLGEYTPFEYLVYNELTFFDEVSEKMKGIRYKSLQESLETCFKPEYLNRFYPNVEKVQQCQSKVQANYLKPYETKRRSYFLNSK